MFKQRLESIEERIVAACRRADRPRSEVRLMAVSKTHPASAIVEAMEAGVMLFGENRVQEFERKQAELDALGVRVTGASQREGVEVHLIGHLQSNKTAKATQLFTAVDTVDSLRIASRLNEAAAGIKRSLPVLLEIKLSAEEAKTGLDPVGTELRELLERVPELTSLKLRGLMTVPPLDDDPETARASFRRLRELRDELSRAHPALDFSALSMGMSGDFEVAIEEGSTLVRIGTALFGAREKRVD
jgi:pyridoxal phosphate enzyme (YggS family)